jgi:branched-chain amino acid transport system substrate-binding protein
MKKGVLLISLALLLAISLVVVGCPAAPKEAKTLKIGMITSVTGPMAPAFKPCVDAAQPAADLVNQKGGITVSGQQYLIEVVVEDDKSSPPDAVGAANKLIGDGVKFLIAPMFMPCNMAITPVCKEAKILRMKPLGSGPEECNPETPYTFEAGVSLYNIVPTYDYLVKNYPGVKRVAMVWPDDPGMNTTGPTCEQETKNRGLEVVFNERYPIPTEDFYPILTKALEQKPDAICCVTTIVPWAAGIINQSRELGFTGPIYAPNLFGDINLVNSMLKPEYAYDIFHSGPDVLSDKMLPIVKDFRPMVEAVSGTPLIMDNVLTLDALWDILQGIDKAQSLDVDKVVGALEKMTSIDTVWGKGRVGGQDLFGINHIVIHPVPFSRIMNGKVEQLEFAEPVGPASLPTQ